MMDFKYVVIRNAVDLPKVEVTCLTGKSALCGADLCDFCFDEPRVAFAP